MSEQGAPWWERRWGVAALALLAALPLLWPAIPPLVDLPGHMGRYRVELEIAHSPTLQHFYSFHWALIGNLGIDLLIVPVAKIFGVELGTKLIVLAIPPLTVAGFLWVAREVHGRVPPTALFSIPFAYGHPFIFGFVNFALSMALAFLAFAFWLRLARQGRTRLRAILFVPLSMALWVVHTYGWGALGVMAFSAELVRQYDSGKNLVRAGFASALHCLALAPPILLMLIWRSGQHVGGETGDWFNWQAKYLWLISVLRDRWYWFDVASLAVVIILLFDAIRSPRLSFSRNLAASALFLLLVYLLLPRIVFGSAYADMRLVPYLIAVAVIAIRLRDPSPAFARALALLGMAFVLLRIGGNTISFWMLDRAYRQELPALDHVPEGARMVSFVGTYCNQPWNMSRLEHLPAMAIVRRRAYSNDQWSMAGAQLLRTIYTQGRGYAHDASEIVTERRCRGEYWRSIDQSLAGFPRDAFDYVWLIRPPPYDPALTRGLQPIWRNGTSVLYKVVDRTPAALPPPAGAAPVPNPPKAAA
ncbi:MAG TPA: hypothetical protein VFW19_17445 [Allosphingosinicella sp.]|nr:hypothetical protein [Allosphingosinicella sp.]